MMLGFLIAHGKKTLVIVCALLVLREIVRSTNLLATLMPPLPTTIKVDQGVIDMNTRLEGEALPVKPASTKPLQAGLEKEKTSLYLITPSSRPHLLLKSIFHVLPLHQCFDVHWIIVHTVQDQRVFKAPLFRDVFHWITELSTFNEESISGNHERNVGLSHVVERASHGLVYFLDDDNVLSMDLCQQDVQNELDIEKMYYADQIQCSSPRLETSNYPSRWTCASSTQVNCSDFSLLLATDTGSWLTPVWLLKQEQKITWDLHRYDADGIYFTAMVKALLAHDGNDVRIQRLPMVKFMYNELRCTNKPSSSWSDDQLHDSLFRYRNLTREMELVRETLPIQEKMDRSEVTFHEYPHILHVLRSCISASHAIYVEIGVWKGATSIFMSRHPLLTDIIGIDGFFFDGQRNEAEGYRKALQGNGTIHWLKNYSTKALPDLQLQLNGKEIDILFIDGDHSTQGVKDDFALYAPLVAVGGFVVFDDFTDTSMSSGVREAVMNMIRDGEISLERYEIIGSVENVMGAGPAFVEDNFFYDWQGVMSNEFVLRKLIVK